MTLDQYNRFTKFYQDWSSKYVSDDESLNDLWQKTHRFSNTEPQEFNVQATLFNNEKALFQPPYHHYQQYHIVDNEK